MLRASSLNKLSFSYRGHSGAVPAAGGQCLCFLERKLTFRWRLPLRTRYVVVLSPYHLPFIASFTVKLLLTCIHLLFTLAPNTFTILTGCQFSLFASRSRGWYQHGSHPRPGSCWPWGAAHHEVGPKRWRAHCSRLLWARYNEIPSWKPACWGASCWAEGQQLDRRLSQHSLN